MLSRGRKWGLTALAIVAVLVAGQMWLSRGMPTGPAPELAGTGLDGSPLNLREVLNAAGGKPVLLTFWATWCPTCKAEEGNIQSVSADYPVLSVALWSEGSDKVAEYVQERQITYPTINDPEAAAGKAWRIRGVPAHFVIDSGGNIRFSSVGYATTWGLRARLWWAERFAP